MEVGTEGSDYSGRIEVWWISEKKYRIEIRSAKFSQIKTINGEKVQEQTEGDYYPRWLENFVLALLDPVWMASNFAGRTASLATFDPEPHTAVTMVSVNRDDRVDGITDPMTVGSVIFNGPEFLVRSTHMFHESMVFGDWTVFGKKQIARTYETNVLDQQKLVGHLLKLEALKHPDESMFEAKEDTPASQRISTVFIPTAQAEKLQESAPAMDWPSVREGRTDGYMIIFARTDRSGQVRETAEYSSHNPNDALQKYGMEQALKYRFKPLVVDGATVQFETPLVMHFVSRIDNPIPILSVDEMKRQMLSCNPRGLPKGPLPSGNVMHCRIAVDEKGAFWGFVSSDPMKVGEGAVWGPALNSLKECTFRPYIVNGQPTFFKGDIELEAR
ncbi:MAG: hypothetical protein P4K93_04220 [Terracidiphilus sp.]|nr:hypothetical protein [Terracidiphilus sp.]